MSDSADEMSAPLTHTQMHTSFLCAFIQTTSTSQRSVPTLERSLHMAKKTQTGRGDRGKVFQVKFMLTGHCYQISPGHTPLLPPFFLQTSAHSEPEWLCESLRPWRTPQRS